MKGFVFFSLLLIALVCSFITYVVCYGTHNVSMLVIAGGIVVVLFVVFYMHYGKKKIPLDLVYKDENGTRYRKNYFSVLNQDKLVGIAIYGTVYSIKGSYVNGHCCSEEYVTNICNWVILRSHIKKFNEVIKMLQRYGIAAECVEDNALYFICYRNSGNVLAFNMENGKVECVDGLAKNIVTR